MIFFLVEILHENRPVCMAFGSMPNGRLNFTKYILDGNWFLNSGLARHVVAACCGPTAARRIWFAAETHRRTHARTQTTPTDFKNNVGIEYNNIYIIYIDNNRIASRCAPLRPISIKLHGDNAGFQRNNINIASRFLNENVGPVRRRTVRDIDNCSTRSAPKRTSL